jgi:hypothetical protein
VIRIDHSNPNEHTGVIFIGRIMVRKGDLCLLFCHGSDEGQTAVEVTKSASGEPGQGLSGRQAVSFK